MSQAQRLIPPFTQSTAHAKVKAAQRLWNTRQPDRVVPAYTEDTIWRNRDQFLVGHEQVRKFLTAKWEREKEYRLRKELFCFSDHRIAVQFWYEYKDVSSPSSPVWKRCYGLEDWTFSDDGTGRMRKRMMSGNDIVIEQGERWFTGDNEEEWDKVEISEKHW